MKQFSCGDVVPGCASSFQGRTDEDILSAVAEHAGADHGLIEVPPPLVEQVRAHIVSV
jgi:predicted small metal-binding protein